ncbi:MAG TPA: ribonuclease III [Saliniramus sp.]|nr:ribonuclease III [Saliniramus sp.]
MTTLKRGPKAGLPDLEEQIGHHFGDRGLLTQALTHTSVARPVPNRHENYQRLEYLGDRVLGLMVAHALYERFPEAKEGELSRRLAELVRKETCAEVAEAWGVAPHIVFGSGVPRTANRANRSILGDVCESIIGAVFLDGGYDAAQRVVERGFDKAISGPAAARRDPKTALQEWIQSKGGQPPVYTLVERTGPEHAPHFRIEVAGAGLEPIEGAGASKRSAEQNAAENALRALGLREDNTVE